MGRSENLHERNPRGRGADKSIEDLLSEMRENPDPRTSASPMSARWPLTSSGRQGTDGRATTSGRCPGRVTLASNLQDAGGTPYQVRQVLQAIDRLLEEKKP